MTVYLPGQTVTRDVEWREFPPNGPLIDLLNVQIEIVPLGGGASVIGPTSVGVTNPSVGRDVYSWVTSPNQAPGQYVWVWTGNDPAITGSIIETSEVVTLGALGTDDGTTGPCTPWDPIIICDLTGSAAVSGYALDAASETLYALSGMRFGLCTVTVRPCRRDCYGTNWPGGGAWYEFGTWPRPLFFDGVWLNIICGGCESDCSCAALSEVKLPRDVHDVVEVKVDGVLLDETAYDLQYTAAGPLLVRTDGGRWPTCNDFRLDDDQVGTWSITARYGEELPRLGQIAVGELTCEYVKAMLDDPDCGLPPNVQSVVRQGITIELLDPNTVFENGLVGLRFSDRFIRTYNPNGLQERTKVYDVDGPSFRLTGR